MVFKVQTMSIICAGYIHDIDDIFIDNSALHFPKYIIFSLYKLIT